ncbi:unnamed protein product [Oikopleura dioica]|uniref:Uncharacterized protein n=1 Tax=Oikopleura dioica TaxID=34765 RepID=E4YTV9_OIKDI|nr:unnamed protein product [Oikopleura dioica]
MNTKISFTQTLRNKESDEYKTKKAEILEELQIKLENIASIENAELQFEQIDIDFEETSGELRQSTGQTMKAVITVPYQLEYSEFLNEDQEQTIEDDLRETTITTLSSMLDEGLSEDSLLQSDPDFRFSSTRQSFDLTRWNHARLSFSFYNATLLLFISLKLLL